jgi:uncharacterized protein YyaL (SSP411 family)
MEHESFEDSEVAKLLNAVFVSIKVDREERPDIDMLYMQVCQALTGSGGWPLSIFMTPDKKPFFATTYIPKESRFGRPGMLELVPQIKKIWETRRDDVLNSADEIVAALKEKETYIAGEELGVQTLELAFGQLSQRYDDKYGGFGNAPKFPTPHTLSFLLRYWQRTGSEKALAMVNKTLEDMRFGGIYDHVGFGFHRYATDREWLVPHFEKMLYDQALLAIAYIEASQATGDNAYAATAHEIFTYVLRDMTSPEGGFYSAEDADSEGVEGKFYLWTEDQIRQALKKDEADLIIRVFNVSDSGNFSDEVTREKTGANILHLQKPLAEIGIAMEMSEKDLQKKVADALKKLFTVRKKRIHPHKDDKILTDWNGLMIAALAKGAKVLHEPRYVQASKKAANFILKTLRSQDGRLMHRYRDGEVAVLGNLDDYAFLIWGLRELYEVTFELSYLQSALELQVLMLQHFWDDQAGGFYFTPDDGEPLFVRQKEIYDGAIPSGNSVAMLNLLALGRITAQPEFEQKAKMIGAVFSGGVRQMPSVYTQLMNAVAGVGPSYEVIIAGNSKAADTRAMAQSLWKYFVPNKIVLLRPTDVKSPKIVKIAAYTQNQTDINGKATAYVCTNYNCKLPTTDTGKMLELLGVKSPQKKE